jgi:putative ABC transport system permease protein
MIHWGESIRFAWSALSVDKVKASLTMLGVTIGTISIVLVVTIFSTGRVYIMNQIQGIGSNLAYAELERGGAVTIPEDELAPADLIAIREQLPVVTAAAGTFDTPVDLQVASRSVRAALVGVTPEFQQIRHLAIVAGRYFDAEDFTSRARVCLITQRLAESPIGRDLSIGAALRLSQVRCTVIGTFREGVPTFGESEIQDFTVLVPFPLIRNITGENFFQVIYAQAADVSEVQKMTTDIEKLLRNRHRPGARYVVRNLDSLLRTANRASLALTAVLLTVAVLMLVTAGAGIMNIMLVNVAERVNEIGVRKALGATANDIRLQFLLEAVFISLTGALAGVILAVVLVCSAGRLFEAAGPIGVSGLSVVVALLLPALFGVIFGYRPASEAARLNPIDALHIE